MEFDPSLAVFPFIAERIDSLPNTLEDGEKIESKNPEVDDGCESMEPKSSEVKEEDEEEESNCFLPSIIFIQPLK